MKSKTKLLLIGLMLVGLSGCVRYGWIHPNYLPGSLQAEQALKRDGYECEKDMRQSGYFGGGIIGAMNAQEFGERCMQARGYSKVKID
jgi:hypothetical protein